MPIPYIEKVSRNRVCPASRSSAGFNMIPSWYGSTASRASGVKRAAVAAIATAGRASDHHFPDVTVLTPSKVPQTLPRGQRPVTGVPLLEEDLDATVL